MLSTPQRGAPKRTNYLPTKRHNQNSNNSADTTLFRLLKSSGGGLGVFPMWKLRGSHLWRPHSQATVELPSSQHPPPVPNESYSFPPR